MYYINPKLKYRIIDNISNKLSIVHKYKSIYVYVHKKSINTLWVNQLKYSVLNLEILNWGVEVDEDWGV